MWLTTLCILIQHGLGEKLHEHGFSVHHLHVCFKAGYKFVFIYREKNPFKRPCEFHCSWRVVAISLTFLTLILSSVIVYFGGKKNINTYVMLLAVIITFQL